MQRGAARFVRLRDDVSRLVRRGDEVAAVVGHQCADLDGRQRQSRLDRRAELVDALARARGREQRLRLEAAQHHARVVVDEVRLVEDHDLGDVARADVADHVAHRLQLRGRIGVRGIDDVHDDIGVADLLERRAERLDELVRQVADEADRVGERVDATVGRLGSGGPWHPASRTARSRRARPRS